MFKLALARLFFNDVIEYQRLTKAEKFIVGQTARRRLTHFGVSV